MPSERHNRLRGRQPIVVAIVAAVAGLVTAMAGLHPTGSPAVDVVLAAAAASAVTWAAGSAPWWAVLMACGIAAAFAANSVWMIVAFAGALLALLVGVTQRSAPWARALAALTAIQVFARLGEFGFFGLTSLVAVTVLASVFVLGVRRRSQTVRRRVWTSVAGAAAAAGLAIAGVAIAGVVARAPLEEGNLQARSGLAALKSGDVHTAAAAFLSAADAFDKADSDLSAPWAQAGRFLPVIAQHRDALAQLASQGARAMRVAGVALSGVDPNALRIVNGQIDLATIRSLVQPFTDLHTAISDVASTITGIRSPWLVAPLQHRLTTLDDDVVKNGALADNALLAMQVAPDLLGGEGARHYFVAFTTPSESRGLGGFMGNWAEVTLDHGRFTLSSFGRTGDLGNGGPNPTGRKITGPPEFVKQWGRFGFVDPVKGTVAVDAWSNITMAPDFPSVAQVIAELYPQSGGRKIDGVFYVDPEVMAKLVGITGPLQVAGVAEPLTEANFVNFILRDQYQLTASDQRIELLDVIAHSVVNKLFSAALPPPANLGRTFGPLARQDRLMAWSVIPKEEDLFTRLGMAGAFPQLNGGDGLTVTTDNANGNKIDAYLHVAVTYASVLTTSGETTGTATITLTNDAPASGLPSYVIGNVINLPTGTNRTFLSVYSALSVTGVELDGATIGMQYSRTFGWNSSTMFLDIPPGQTRTLTLQMRGTLSPGPYRFVSRTQPMALPETMKATAG